MKSGMVKSGIKRLLIRLNRWGLMGKAVHGYTVLKSLQQPDTLWKNARYRLRSGPDGLPIPNAPLRFMVSGGTDIAGFLEMGQLGADSIQSTLSKNGLDIGDFQSILDFGCGCGRVIRHWKSLDKVQVVGTDYNLELIDWCRENLSFATFKSNQLAPPMDFENERFDCIYALSVFTHMTEQLQFDWMAELTRVLKPGGYLLFSTHGDHYQDRVKPEDLARYKAGKIVVANQELAGTNYCTTFHPQSYVESTLSRGFQIVDFIPQGAKGNPEQDLYLFQKLPTDSAVETSDG
ncbi:MAG: SAM-dependent methyltransferase [Gammaproteobacteria bacterium]|jgi:SAM-dependent methyltransferase